MLNSTDRMANEKAEREAAAKSARRAEEASIVAGLRSVLQADEQLLGFARARIAGGIKGRLNIGPEAFFAPYVNIGLTERRFVIQHLHGETGRPSEILPHFFALADLQSIHFADIETYGGTPASRLVLHLTNGQSFRLRLIGENNFASSKSLAEVFRSLTSVRKSASGPTQRVCISCKHIMDRPSKFCPYCGASQMDVETADSSGASAAADVLDDAILDAEKVTVVVTEPHTDLLDDALEFLRNEPVQPPVTAPEPGAESASPVTEAAHEQPAADAGGTSEPAATIEITDDLTEPAAVASEPSAIAEPIASDSNESGTMGSVEGAADASVKEETTELASEMEEIPGKSAEAASNESDAARENRPAPTYAFPDFSSSSPWQVPASPFAAAQAPDLQHAIEPSAAQSVTSEAPGSSHAPGGAVEEAHATEDAVSSASGFSPPASTYSEAGSSEANTVPSEEAPQMPIDSASATKLLRVHFHINHPAVRFDEVITGKDADEVVAKLKDRVVAELKFPIKLAAMRLSPLEFAQEIVSKYNQEERQALPRPNSCREFLHLVQAIGYATVDAF